MKANRRTVLRGLMGGAVTSVGLPVLDCFLNTNGTAWANTGKALPPVFGTWFQHLGFNPGMWEPKKVGTGYENNIQLKVLDGYRERLNIYSGLKYFIEGRPLQTHTTGSQIATLGMIPFANEAGASIDSRIADVIGQRRRFRSLEVNLSGVRQSYSQRNGTSINPSEASPLALYTRIFGPEFKNPNAETFEPDPMAMARKSVLSTVTEHLRDVRAELGVADRARLEEYLTSIRQIEQQLTIELEKPAPLPACRLPDKEQEATPGTVLEDAAVNCKIFAGLLGHAAACGQSQVFNVMMGTMNMRRAGTSYTWHTATHEESVDEKLGYQKDVFEFNKWANLQFLEFIKTLDAVKEGPGTLLDRSLILWQTDHSDARVHGLEKVPVMTVGSGGGRIKTGIHVAAPGDPVTRVGLTCMQALGVPIQTWGERGNATSRMISEVMA
jgi:hypothetical protein